MKPTEVAQIFSAIFTALIALITTTIAIQQYIITRRKLRHDLFDRRIAIYDSLMELIRLSIRNDEQLNIDALNKFKADTNQAFFLFDRDVREYLDSVHKKAIELRKRQIKSEDDSDILEWFSMQFDESQEKFAKYLMLKSLR